MDHFRKNPSHEKIPFLTSPHQVNESEVGVQQAEEEEGGEHHPHPHGIKVHESADIFAWPPSTSPTPSSVKGPPR